MRCSETSKSFPKVYENEEIPTRVFRLALVALVAAAACLIFGLCAFDQKFDTVKKVILAVWTLGVPCWFAYEFWWVYRCYGNHSKEEFEIFKHGQELANRIWLALVAVLSILYFGRELIHR